MFLSMRSVSNKYYNELKSFQNKIIFEAEMYGCINRCLFDTNMFLELLAALLNYIKIIVDI